MIGIYKITSPSKKVYIGQSVNISSRENAYKHLHCKGQPKVYRSILKYGWDKHKFEVIHQCEKEELNDLEAYYIELYQSFNSKHGLNLQSGGNSRFALSAETRKKIGEKNKGKFVSEETRIKIRKYQSNRSESHKAKMKEFANSDKNKASFAKVSANFRKSLTEERKREIGKKVGESNKGRKLSPGTIEKLKIRLKGIPRPDHVKEKIRKTMTGHKYSKERVEKSAAALRGRKLTKEHSEKISKALKGRVFSEEHRKKLSEWQIGRKLSEEHKKKMSLQRKGKPTWNKGTKGIMKAWNKGLKFDKEKRTYI